MKRERSTSDSASSVASRASSTVTSCTSIAWRLGKYLQKITENMESKLVVENRTWHASLVPTVAVAVEIVGR